MEITQELVNEVNKNIEQAEEFLRYLIYNQPEMEKIPNGSHIRFVDSTQGNSSCADGENIINIHRAYEFSNPSPAG